MDPKRNLPYSVGGGRRDVDCQCPFELLHFHSKQEGGVGHLLHLLLDELCLSGFLEILGLGNLVHEAYDLAGPVATNVARRRRAILKSESDSISYS